MSEVSNHGLAWLATSIPLLFVCILVISARVAWKNEDWKETDVGVLIALGFAIAQEIAGCVGILIWGLGYDAAFLGPEKVQKAIMCLFISRIFYQTTIAANKIALVFFYLDFLSTSNLRLIHHVTAISIFLSAIAFDTATIFQCTPISYLWDRNIARGHCTNLLALSIAHASTNIFFYLLLCILTIPISGYLHLSPSKKCALTCAYIIGCLVLTTSILNLSYLIPQPPRKSSNIQPQPSIIPLFTYSLESLLGLLLLSLSTLHTPISHLFTSLSLSLPPLRLPLPTTTITLTNPFFTRALPPPPTTSPTLTRFPSTSAWKSLKSLKSLQSTSSFRSFKSRSSRYSRSHASHLPDLDANRSVDDEMMVYVTILGDLHPTLQVENRTAESYV